MSGDEIRRIEEDIEKSGVPLEIEVSSRLEEDGWEVMLHDYYVDEEEGKNREMDVGAWKRFDFDGGYYDHLHVSLIVECKRSVDKPWVFYTSPKGREFEVPRFMMKRLSVPKPRTLMEIAYEDGWMLESHYFSPRFDKKAIISYEPFTDGKGQRIFEASMQVIKALAYAKKMTAKMRTYIKKGLHLYYPMIVFDGHLFEYTSERKVSPIMYVQYLVRHRFASHSTSELVGDVFLIDVLRKEFLPKYLEILRHEFDAIKDKLVSWAD